MNLEEKHPAEIQFRYMMSELDAFLTKYESKYLDGPQREVMGETLKYLYKKVEAIREERFFQYAGEEGVPVNMPDEEKDIQLDLFYLQKRIRELSERLE